MTIEIVNGQAEMIQPCLLTLYKCGCAEVHADALLDFADERQYMPLVRITSIENGGEVQDHSRCFDYQCGQLIGFSGAFPAYCDFLKFYGLLPWSR